MPRAAPLLVLFLVPSQGAGAVSIPTLANEALVVTQTGRPRSSPGSRSAPGLLQLWAITAQSLAFTKQVSREAKLHAEEIISSGVIRCEREIISLPEPGLIIHHFPGKS